MFSLPMDSADYFEEESESMEVGGEAGLESDMAIAMEVSVGEPSGGVVSQVGVTVAAVLEKVVVGALAKAVRNEMAQVLVSIL